MNTRTSHETYANVVQWNESPEYRMVLRGGYDAKRGKAVLDVDWFLPAGRGLWRHERERVEEVSWTDAEIRRALRRAGLRFVRAWDGVDVRPPERGARRGTDAYYLAAKP